MNAIAIPVDARLALLLPDAGFADAYRITCTAPALNARQASLAIFDSPPPWINGLMALRNRVVGLFGLKAGVRPPSSITQDSIGIFPVLAESPEEMLMGLDDLHLDFRVAVTVQPAVGGAQQITVTTVVHTHNRLGRIYLTVIMPFHRLIARSMLNRAARFWRESV